MDNNFQINTGYIFRDLKKYYKNYDRMFLVEVVEAAYQAIAYSSKKISVDFDGENGGYLDNYSLVRYPRDLGFASKHENFPFPEYFLRGKRDCDYKVIVEYGMPYVLPKKNEYFDLFFALKFSIIDLMEAENFLQYHFKKTFKNDVAIFKIFIENICIKYDEFLAKKYTPIATRFFNTLLEKNEPAKENKEFTTARQVLAISLLLEEIGITSNNTDKTEIARFIQFLTGRQMNAKDIKNTDIYKRIGQKLNHSDKRTIKDLQFVRTFFENMEDQSIVDKIFKTFHK